MKKATLARLEIYVSLALAGFLLVLAGYALVAQFADRLDPKVRACVEHAMQNASLSGQPMARLDAVKLCKHLESIDALP